MKKHIHVHDSGGKFDESKHKRDKSGKFSSTGGSGTGSSEAHRVKQPEPRKAHAAKAQEHLKKAEASQDPGAKQAHQEAHRAHAAASFAHRSKRPTAAAASKEAEQATKTAEYAEKKSAPPGSKESKHYNKPVDKSQVPQDQRQVEAEKALPNHRYEQLPGGGYMLMYGKPSVAYFNTKKGSYAPNTAGSPEQAMKYMQAPEGSKLKEVSPGVHHVISPSGKRFGNFELHTGEMGQTRGGQSYFFHGGKSTKF